MLKPRIFVSAESESTLGGHSFAFDFAIFASSRLCFWVVGTTARFEVPILPGEQDVFCICKVAEDNHVDVFVVGSELVSSESHEVQWEKTIDGIRDRFHGKITYSANWDHYSSIGFWDMLDLIGMNSFWVMGSDNQVTVTEIESRWHEIQKDLVAFSAKQGKPLILLEVGYFSQTNAAREPWDYTRDLDLDLELQRKLYEGFFRSWYGNPNLGGFMIWEWIPGGVPADDKFFSPQNKPAEKVLAEWLAKEPWGVK